MDANCTNCTEDPMPDLAKGFTLLFILIASAIGNLLTLYVLLRLKETRIPDILVLSLAITDLVATLIPIPMSLYSYFTGIPFPEGYFACNFYGTVAQWTRYTSAILVTLISLDRYLSIAHPVMYSIRVRRWHIVVAILASVSISSSLSVAPWISPDTTILTGEAICLFSFLDPYAYVIVIYAAVQFVVVLYCFSAIVYHLCRIYRRRRRMKLQGQRNIMSSASFSSGPTFTKPGLSARISDINKSLKKAAPLIGESLKLSVEAQFARMLLAITALFYLSWLPIVSLVVYALAIGIETGEAQREALFWAIRLTVVSTAINPIMYGLLCRQYRQLYIYLFRQIFSCCCSCVRAPYYNPFKHRDQPPKNVETKMKREKQRREAPPPERLRFFGSYRSLQSFYSQMSQQSTFSKQPLTRATTHTHISLPHLFGIEEELTSLNDTSTHVPTAGDLNSTVVISEYARRQGSQKGSENHQVLSARSASFGNFDAPVTYFDTSLNPALMEDGSLHRVNPLHGFDMDGIAAEEATTLFPGEFLDQGKKSRDVYANPAFSLASVKDDAEMKQPKDLDRAWLDRRTLKKAAAHTKGAGTEVTDSESSSEESESEEEEGEEEEGSSGSEYTASEIEEETPQKAGAEPDSESSSAESRSTTTEQESGKEVEADEPVEVGSSGSSEELSESSEEGEEQTKESDVLRQTTTVDATTAVTPAPQDLNKLKMNEARKLPRLPPTSAMAKNRLGSILPSTSPPVHEEGILNKLDLTEEFEEIEKLLQSVTSELPSLKL